MLLGILGRSSLGNLLTGTIRAGECKISTSQSFLMLSDPLTNFEMQKYFQNKPKFNDVYSRNNLPKIKDEPYVIDVDEYKSIAIH